MKRILLALLIGAIVVLMAVPVGAAKPDKPGKPDHPEGLTCEDYAAEYGLGDLAEPDWSEDGSMFTLKLTPETNSACIDLVTGAAVWSVGATLNSALNYGLSIKDSVPGDFCFFYRGKDPTVPIGAMPGATIDVCGDEWTDSDPALVFQAWAKVKRGGSVTLDVTLSEPPDLTE